MMTPSQLTLTVCKREKSYQRLARRQVLRLPAPGSELQLVMLHLSFVVTSELGNVAYDLQELNCLMG